jgi:heat shock protein HtpX
VVTIAQVLLSRMVRLPLDPLADHIAANKRRSVVLVAVAVAMVAIVVWALAALFGGGWLGLVIGVVLGLGGAAGAYLKSDAVALSVSRARPAEPEDYPRLHNLVEGLCAAAGLPKPDLFVIDDQAPNAFAIGRNPRHAAIVFTAGLVEKLNRMELEGVVAQELSHVKNYDILPSTLAVTLVALPGALVPPLRARALRLAVGPRREALGDVSGVALTRYPPGLISALEKLRLDDTVVAPGSRATDHLWLDSSMEDVDERIAALREL